MVLEKTSAERDGLLAKNSELSGKVKTLTETKRKLEQDAKSLLERCAVPKWNNGNKRRPTLR